MAQFSTSHFFSQFSYPILVYADCTKVRRERKKGRRKGEKLRREDEKFVSSSRRSQKKR
jgi:hypothetical protein